MHAHEFYPISNDYITTQNNNGSKLMRSGYQNNGPLRNSLVTSSLGRTRNDDRKKFSLSLNNGTAETQPPPKSGMG